MASAGAKRKLDATTDERRSKQPRLVGPESANDDDAKDGFAFPADVAFAPARLNEWITSIHDFDPDIQTMGQQLQAAMRYAPVDPTRPIDDTKRALARAQISDTLATTIATAIRTLSLWASPSAASSASSPTLNYVWQALLQSFRNRWSQQMWLIAARYSVMSDKYKLMKTHPAEQVLQWLQSDVLTPENADDWLDYMLDLRALYLVHVNHGA